jgi:hypothetical protein
VRQQMQENSGASGNLYSDDPDHMGLGRNPNADEMDGRCTATGDFQGIGLLDPCWKVVEKIMVRHMGAIEFHPCLHRGLPRGGQARQH